jgi:hypothetical protein
MFGIDRSPVIGFVEIAVFLTGLGIICIGVTLLDGLWNGTSKTIASDISCVSFPRVCDRRGLWMADIFGLAAKYHP